MNTFNNGEISTFRTRQHLVSGFVCFPLSFQEACFGSRVTCIVHGVIFASPSSSLCHPLSNRKPVDQTPPLFTHDMTDLDVFIFSPRVNLYPFFFSSPSSCSLFFIMPGTRIFCLCLFSSYFSALF